MERGKGRRNEQVARSEAECQMEEQEHDDRVWPEAMQEPDDGDQPSSVPSFLVPHIANVNAQLWRARGLITVWDFLEYKGRVGRTNVILNRKDDPRVLRVMPMTSRSRYFEDGRLFMSRRIRRRLGKYEKVPGLMETLTYDPKKIGKQEAWASFGKDTRRFLNAVNQYRTRRGWRRAHCLWVVEVQRQTGYPHIHIFFPNLRFLAPLRILNGNWRRGRANVESPRKITVNCAAYISKYLRKMRGWSDLHLALLWSGRSRMYGFSRGFSAKEERKESEWRRWGVIQSRDPEAMLKSFEGGGFVIDRNEKKD